MKISMLCISSQHVRASFQFPSHKACLFVAGGMFGYGAHCQYCPTPGLILTWFNPPPTQKTSPPHLSLIVSAAPSTKFPVQAGAGFGCSAAGPSRCPRSHKHALWHISLSAGDTQLGTAGVRMDDPKHILGMCCNLYRLHFTTYIL